jgi:hypothetical protein
MEIQPLELSHVNRTPPPYIAEANLPGTPPDYVWNDEVEEEVMFHQPRIANRIGRMSDRAALAFSLGAIEWTLWRLRTELPDDRPFQFLDAAYGGLVDWLYLKSFDLPTWEEEFDRAVGGPLAASFWLLQEAFTEARRGRPFIHMPVSISEVALRVCGRPDAFKAWRRTVIERLVETDPMNLPAPTGRPVPRDILDPSYVPSPSADSERIGAYLAGLDWRTNPFLRPPDVMRADGFEGVPYAWPARVVGAP